MRKSYANRCLLIRPDASAKAGHPFIRGGVIAAWLSYRALREHALLLGMSFPGRKKWRTNGHYETIM